MDEWPPQILIQGGLINGNPVPPMTYLMHSLAERWGQLGEEERTQAVQQLMSFNRRSGERIDDLLTRFDIIRNRAQQTGQLAMGFEGYSFLLLRAVGVSDQQLTTLLEHYNMVYPNSQAQLQDLMNRLRRTGHMLEHAPGNLATAVNQHGGGAHAFPAFDGQPNAGDGWGGGAPASCSRAEK